jgi:hypothetical protein
VQAVSSLDEQCSRILAHLHQARLFAGSVKATRHPFMSGDVKVEGLSQVTGSISAAEEDLAPVRREITKLEHRQQQREFLAQRVEQLVHELRSGAEVAVGSPVTTTEVIDVALSDLPALQGARLSDFLSQIAAALR